MGCFHMKGHRDFFFDKQTYNLLKEHQWKGVHPMYTRSIHIKKTKKKQRIGLGIFWPLAIAIEPSEGTPESWLKMAVDEI